MLVLLRPHYLYCLLSSAFAPTLARPLNHRETQKVRDERRGSRITEDPFVDGWEQYVGFIYCDYKPKSLNTTE